MLRIIAGFVVGSALFAGVIGSAAALGTITSNLAANGSDVGTCDTGDVDVNYTVAFSNGDYRVTHVTVSDLEAACEGKKVRVTLHDGSGPALGESAEGTVTAGTSGALAVSPNPSAEAVLNIHVVVYNGL